MADSSDRDKIAPDFIPRKIIMGHLNNHLLSKDMHFFVSVLDERDPQYKIIAELKPLIEIWEVHAKPLQGERAEIRPFHVDIRDMIP